MQSDNEVWSDNEIQHEKYFRQKACKTLDRETSSEPVFVFLNKLCIR